MKIISAALLAIFLSSPVLADGIQTSTNDLPLIHVFDSYYATSDWDIVGDVNYAFESETFSTSIGLQYTSLNWSAVGILNAEHKNDHFTFEGTEFGALYNLTTTTDVYGLISLDDDWRYEETTVGVSFRF